VRLEYLHERVLLGSAARSSRWKRTSATSTSSSSAATTSPISRSRRCWRFTTGATPSRPSAGGARGRRAVRGGRRDEKGRVLGFQEKPRKGTSAATWSTPACMRFRPRSSGRFRRTRFTISASKFFPDFRKRRPRFTATTRAGRTGATSHAGRIPPRELRRRERALFDSPFARQRHRPERERRFRRAHRGRRVDRRARKDRGGRDDRGASVIGDGVAVGSDARIERSILCAAPPSAPGRRCGNASWAWTMASKAVRRWTVRSLRTRPWQPSS